MSLPDGSEAVIADEVVALAAAAAGSWGDGRALHALPVDDTVTAVVSTTGVHLAEAGGPSEPLDQFGQPTEVGGVALSEDRSTLALVTLWPSVVRWYDLDERRPTGVAEIGPGGDMLAFGFLGDTQALVAVTPAGVSVWPTGQAGGVATPLTDAFPTGEPAFVGDRLAVPLADTTDIAVIGPASAERVDIDIPDDARVLGVRSSPDSSAAAVAYFTPDGGDSVAVFDASSFGPIGTIDLDVPVQGGAWALTDRALAVADDNTVRWWTHTGDQLGSSQTHGDQIVDELLGRQGDVVAVHHAGATAIALDDATTPSRLIGDAGFTINSAVVDLELGELATVDFYGTIARTDLDADTAPAVDDRFAAGTATAVSIDQDANRIAVAATTGRVELLDAQLTESGSFAVRPEPVLIDDVEFNPATGQLSTGLAERIGAFAFDDTVTAWDADAGAGVYSIGGEGEDVADCGFFNARVAFTNDGALMAVTSHDFTVILADPATGEWVHQFGPLAGTTHDLAFSPDGRFLVATSELGIVTVWNVAERSEVASYPTPLGGYRAIEMMPTGTTMATIDGSGTLQLVDVPTGQNMLTFDESAAPAAAIALSPDGSLLAAPDDDATVSLWSTDSGLRLATLTGHTAAVTDLRFATDGSWIVTSSEDGTVRRWDLEIST